MITIEQKLALDTLAEYINSTINGTVVYNERFLRRDINGNSVYQYSIYSIKGVQLINLTNEFCIALGYKRLKDALKFNTQDSPYGMHTKLLKTLTDHANVWYVTPYQVIE